MFTNDFFSFSGRVDVSAKCNPPAKQSVHLVQFKTEDDERAVSDIIRFPCDGFPHLRKNIRLNVSSKSKIHARTVAAANGQEFRRTAISVFGPGKFIDN